MLNLAKAADLPMLKNIYDIYIVFLTYPSHETIDVSKSIKNKI